MNTRSLKDAVEQRLVTLCQELAEGRGRGITAHLQSHARFRTYSTRNRHAIMAQRPETSRVLSRGTWEGLGREVRGDAQPIFILAPLFFGQRAPAAEINPNASVLALTGQAAPTVPGTLQLPPSGTPERPSGYHAVPVYAAEDTTGDPLRPAAPEPLAAISEETLNALIGLCPYPVVWGDVDEITVLPQLITLPQAAVGQATACLNILRGWAQADWISSNPASKHDDLTRRTEAVLTAYAVGEALGWPNLEFTVGELQLMWGGKPRKLGNALSRIDKSVQRLLSLLSPLADVLPEDVAA